MRLLVALVVLSAALAACGGDDREQISHLMGELRAVQDSGDAEKACEEVYVVRERDRVEEEGGEEDEGCRQAFEQAAAGRDVTNLSTRLVRVDVAGEEGTAVLHTSATRPDGSALDRDVPYDVVKTEKGWRVRIAGEG
jgi:sarcosine oxidase gamma subunit